MLLRCLHSTANRRRKRSPIGPLGARSPTWRKLSFLEAACCPRDQPPLITERMSCVSSTPRVSHKDSDLPIIRSKEEPLRLPFILPPLLKSWIASARSALGSCSTHADSTR